MLKIDLRQLEKRRRITIDEAVDPDAGIWKVPDVRWVGPLGVRLEAQPAGHDVIVRGRILGTVELNCRRCLVPVTIEIDEDVAWVFRPGLTAIQAEEEEVYSLPERGDELDLTDALREQIVLAVPQFAICDESCRGLCAHCGTNLNHTQCDCGTTEIDDRWAALRKLQTE